MDNVVRLPPQSPSRYIRDRHACGTGHGPVAPAVSKSLHSVGTSGLVREKSGCPRSLQVATFSSRPRANGCSVRLPPQSPSRYILTACWYQRDHCPVAPAVSKSLHSIRRGGCPDGTSGCPRSLQVATFTCARTPVPVLVRLPPQSPSRYIRWHRGPRTPRRPVAPAVSKSLHSELLGRERSRTSGCPRSLQVATFGRRVRGVPARVRLPPQSPSRYIDAPRVPGVERVRLPPQSPSRYIMRTARAAGQWVRLPPQSPSRYISGVRHGPLRRVRLPPQSPSRYIAEAT